MGSHVSWDRHLNFDIDVASGTNADGIRRDAEVRPAVLLLDGSEPEDVALEDGLVVRHGGVVLTPPVNFRLGEAWGETAELNLLALNGEHRPEPSIGKPYIVFEPFLTKNKTIVVDGIYPINIGGKINKFLKKAEKEIWRTQEQ